MSQWRQKGREKCKDEPEDNGPAQSGGTSPAGSRSNQGARGGYNTPPSGKNARNNPKDDWTPRQRGPRSNWVKKGGGKNGPSRGGDKAVAAAAQDAVSRADGLKDALREQHEETRVAEQANMHLRRDLTTVTDDLKRAEERLGLLRNRIDQRHDDKRRNFLCEWQDETGRAIALFLTLVCVVPAIFIFLMIYLQQVEELVCWQAVIAGLAYELIAVLADRYVCAKRGYRTVGTQRITHSFKAMTQEDWDFLDRRADVMSLRKLLHDNARYSVIAYRKSLNGVLLNTDKFGQRTGVPTYSMISHELLAQLTVPTVMYADDWKIVQDRLAVAAKTTHTVNVDCYLYQEGEDVARNTAKVALGLWHQSSQRNFASCF